MPDRLDAVQRAAEDAAEAEDSARCIDLGELDEDAGGDGAADGAADRFEAMWQTAKAAATEPVDVPDLLARDETPVPWWQR